MGGIARRAQRWFFLCCLKCRFLLEEAPVHCSGYLSQERLQRWAGQAQLVS